VEDFRGGGVGAGLSAMGFLFCLLCEENSSFVSASFEEAVSLECEEWFKLGSFGSLDRGTAG
jgi:hypothetical protein